MVKYISRIIILKIYFYYSGYTELINKKSIIKYLGSVLLFLTINNTILILNNIILIFNYIKRINKLLILKLLNLLGLNLNSKFLFKVGGIGIKD